MTAPSQRAVDLVVECEVSSRKYYEAHYQHPEWPGGASGVTVAIGYDLGYAALNEFHADWDGRRPVDMLNVMSHCLGVRGDPARSLLPVVRSQILVPWDVAMGVFLEHDVPKWTQRVLSTLPGSERLSADSFGALFSLAYNRGTSWSLSGDRYSEMRAIKQALAEGKPERVPALIRAMKRLWPGVHGLQARRDAEADLFQRGLDQPAAPMVPAKPVVKENPGRQLAPPPAGKQEAGAAAGAGAATGGANVPTADVPVHHVMSYLEVAMIVGEVAVVAVVVWLAVRWWRKRQPVLAREKDPPPVVETPAPTTGV